MKTIFLNKLEKTGLEFWRGDNIEGIFLSLIQDLKLALDNKMCKHFWIPQINLFEDIPDRNLKALSKRLDKIIEDPSPYIQQCQKPLKLKDTIHETQNEFDNETTHLLINVV